MKCKIYMHKPCGQPRRTGGQCADQARSLRSSTGSGAHAFHGDSMAFDAKTKGIVSFLKAQAESYPMLAGEPACPCTVPVPVLHVLHCTCTVLSSGYIVWTHISIVLYFFDFWVREPWILFVFEIYHISCVSLYYFLSVLRGVGSDSKPLANIRCEGLAIPVAEIVGPPSPRLEELSNAGSASQGSSRCA